MVAKGTSSEERAISAWLSTFLPYQREWIEDQTRFSIILKARQIGASHAMGATACVWGMMGETTTIISIGEREAVELLSKVEAHAEALCRLGSKTAAYKRKADRVEFTTTRGRVLALPASSGGRGMSGNSILDEFAYLQNPEAIWDAAGGSVLRGYKMRVISTPNGSGNLFHKLYTDPNASRGYRKFATTIDEAIKQGLEVDLDECWKMARGDRRVFDQMFRCAFLDGDQQYFSLELLNAAKYDPDKHFIPLGERYAGLDIGRTNDLTSLVEVAKDITTGVRYEIRTETCKRTSQEDIEDMVERAIMRGCKRICVDATGLGSFPAEALQRKFGRWKIEPLTFTMGLKEEMATTLYQAFHEDTLKIRNNNDKLVDDLLALRRIVTPSGGIRFDAPRSEDGHADRAWALAMAVHACSGPERKRYEVHA
jgi:phage FluMu gp28-like protein